MSQNPDTLVNPFNAYGPPAFQFAPASPGTDQLCANCGVTRRWEGFNYENGDYICGTCAAWWGQSGGVGQPPDAVINQPERFRHRNEGNVIPRGKGGLAYGDGVYGNGFFGIGSY